MTTAVLPTASTVTPPPAAGWQPRPFRWTVPQFHLLRESARSWPLKGLILIDGELIEMPFPDPKHDCGITLADYLFKAIFGAGHVVRVQLPLPLNVNTDPYPDIAVLLGEPRTVSRDPKNAVLVLEVGNTTVADDLGYMANLYAAAGIPDYWVTDLPGDRVVVHRQPTPDAGARYGHHYAAVTVLGRGDALPPLALPGRPVRADELLP